MAVARRFNSDQEGDAAVIADARPFLNEKFLPATAGLGMTKNGLKRTCLGGAATHVGNFSHARYEFRD
jgi:hypothetical protein